MKRRRTTDDDTGAKPVPAPAVKKAKSSSKQTTLTKTSSTMSGNTKPTLAKDHSTINTPSDPLLIASACPSASPPTLLTLPREIQDIIWQHVYEDQVYNVTLTSQHAKLLKYTDHPYSLGPALIYTSVAGAALGALYRNASFIFRSGKALLAFQKKMEPHTVAIESITQLHLNVDRAGVDFYKIGKWSPIGQVLASFQNLTSFKISIQGCWFSLMEIDILTLYLDRLLEELQKTRTANGKDSPCDMAVSIYIVNRLSKRDFRQLWNQSELRHRLCEVAFFEAIQ
ncbi:hypothetical protein B9Z65_6121 [Elsinoe australis]|uniref:Uncharacterized protein n=1 Tax=Elsinoe australis TaxID=40998 RepID=A0A2P8A7Q2_9PEZI|nr:hypothetical protein B9Z65_6121 [Elsinoe australis]